MSGNQAPGLNGRIVRPWQDQVVRPWEDHPISSQAAPSHPENSQNSSPDPASEPPSTSDGSSPIEGRNPDSSPENSRSPFEKQNALSHLNISPAGDGQDAPTTSAVFDEADQDATGLNGRVVISWEDQPSSASQAAPSHPETSQNSPSESGSESPSRSDGSSPSEGRNLDSSPENSSRPFEKQNALSDLNISPAGDRQDTPTSSLAGSAACSASLLPSSYYQQVSANMELSHLMNRNNYYPPGFPAAASSNGYNPLVPGYLPTPVSPHFMQAPPFPCLAPTGLMPSLNPSFPTLIHTMPPAGYLMPPSSVHMPPALFPPYPVVSPNIMQKGLSTNPQPKSENPQRTYKSQHDRFFTPAQRDVLESWYQANKQNAYAKKHNEMLANATGLSKAQVNKWLSNRRNRDNNTRQRSKPY